MKTCKCRLAAQSTFQFGMHALSKQASLRPWRPPLFFAVGSFGLIVWVDCLWLLAGTIAVILLSLWANHSLPSARSLYDLTYDGSLKFEKDCSLIFTKPLSLIGVTEYWDELACLCVRKHFSETTFRSSQNFLCVTYVCGLVLLWRRCDTLCTSGFVDDVIFVHNGQYRAMEACRYRCSKVPVCHCVVVRRKTARLRRVLHDAGAETKRVHYASDAGRRRTYKTPFPCYVCQKDCV